MLQIDDKKCNESDIASENAPDCSNACGTEDAECSSFGVGDATCADVGCDNGGKPRCTVKCKIDYSVCVPASDEQSMLLEFETTENGWQTSWNITNLDGRVFDVAQGTYKNHDTVKEFRCVDRSCHELTLYNTGENEMGNYSIYFDGVAVDASEFSSSISFEFGTEFCTLAPTAENATRYPSFYPSVIPSRIPTVNPTIVPSLTSSINPSQHPSIIPSLLPSQHLSAIPSLIPSIYPSFIPTQIPTIDTYFRMSSPDPNAQMFGTRIALSQDKVFVSNYFSGKGVVHVFDFGGEYERSVTAPNGANGDEFGKTIAISATYIVVGAPNANNGEGLVYVFSSTSFSLTNTLVANDHHSQGEQRFGESVAISDFKIAVGAPNNDSNKGAVYIYNAIVLFQERKVVPSDSTGTSGGLFGSEIIIHNESVDDSFKYSIFVSSQGYLNGIGALYRYDTEGSFMKILVGSNPGDKFGKSFGAPDFKDFLIIGAPGSDQYGISSGIAFSYTLQNDDVVQMNEIRPENAGAGLNFGYSIAVASNSSDFLITAPGIDGDEVGAVYLFDSDGNAAMMAKNPTGNSNDQYGYHSSYNEEVAVVGAPMHTDENGVENGGRAYIVRSLGN